MTKKILLLELCLLFNVLCFAQIHKHGKHSHEHEHNRDHNHPKVYKAPKYEKGWNKAQIHPDRIVLNLGENPSTSANFTWRTSTEVKNGIVEIAKADGAPKFWRNSISYTAKTELFNKLQPELIEWSANYHSVKVTGLEPNTLYGYRVGDGIHWSEWIQFKTASQKPERFSFLYVGDAQNYILELWSRLIRQGFQKAPDTKFIIHAGDLVNHGNNDSQWQEWFKAGSFIHRMVPSFPVPGNHEYRSIKKGEKKQLSLLWKPQFTLPENGPKGLEESVYYMDYQNVRIIGLNSNEKREEQVRWLEKVLKNNPNKWTVITYHHPLFSASGGRDNEEWRALLKPVLDKYHVDLALQGHDHAYARGRVAPTEYNIPTGVNKRDLTGTVYVVSVSGGKMYSLRENAWDGWDADRERAAENTQLFQVITVDGDILKYESYTATGALYDAFEIIKNGEQPNRFIELQKQAISGRYHDNTIPYYDTLPLDIKSKVLKKYRGFKIRKVNLYENDSKELMYSVKIKKGKTEYKLILDEEGNFVKEKLD